MKQNIMLTSFLLFLPLVTHTEDKPITIHNEHSINLSIENSGNNANTNATSLHLVQEIAIELYVKLKSSMQALQKQIKPKQWKASLLALLAQYKYRLIGGTLVSVYAYLCYQTIKANHYLDNPDLWSRWQEDLDLEQLLEIPQKELAGQLLRAVQARYTNPTNPVDFINPLIIFLDEARTELKLLRWYARLYVWLKRIYFHKITPLNEARFAAIDEQIKRLVHLKNIFHSWMAEYNIAHNKRTPSCKKAVLEIGNEYMSETA